MDFWFMATERRGYIKSAAESADTGNIATNRQGVDIVSAFVGRYGLKIHKMPDHGIAIGNADGAK
jgi:hypothetical protein